MKRMAERDDQVSVAAGREDTLDLTRDGIRIFRMLEDGVTFDPGELVIRKWKLLSVCGHVHACERKQIEVNIPVYSVAGASNIQIPATQRSVDVPLVQIVDVGSGRL